jgi:hypothetical protein
MVRAAGSRHVHDAVSRMDANAAGAKPLACYVSGHRSNDHRVGLAGGHTDHCRWMRFTPIATVRRANCIGRYRWHLNYCDPLHAGACGACKSPHTARAGKFLEVVQMLSQVVTPLATHAASYEAHREPACGACECMHRTSPLLESARRWPSCRGLTWPRRRGSQGEVPNGTKAVETWDSHCSRE